MPFRAVLTWLLALLLASSSPLPATAFWHGSPTAPVPPDSFTAGIYFPSTVPANPDVATSTPLLSGFVRGLTGTVTWSATNVGGGTAYGTMTPTSGNNYASLLAGAGLSAAATGTYQTDVAATNGVTTYTQRVTISKLAASVNIAISGGNVLRATANPGVAPNNTTLKTYATPTYATTGDAQLPSNLFPTYMRFFGNANLQLGAQAWINQVPTSTGPMFIVGFMQAQAEQSNGAIGWYGNNTRRTAGQIVQTLTYVAGTVHAPAVFGYQFMWVPPDNSFIITASGGPAWTVPGSADANFVLNVWQAYAIILNPAVDTNTNFWVDGVFATNQGNAASWPVAIGGDVLGIGFGSFGPQNAGAASGDIHAYSGALRNVSAVLGVPTGPELEAFRNGGDPAVIWPGQVWATWAFNTNLRTAGLTIPDTTGNGHHLAVADLGNQAGHALPYLVTDGVPYIADGYGPGGTNLFELVDTGGGNYRIQTRAGLAPSAYYGTYSNVLLISHGYQWPLVLYVNDGS